MGGGGVGGWEESCDLLQKLHFLHISHKLTNVSTAFKYVYLWFFYKQNTLMNKNFRTYNYFQFFFIQKIFYNFYTKRVI